MQAHTAAEEMQSHALKPTAVTGAESTSEGSVCIRTARQQQKVSWTAAAIGWW